MRRPAFLLAVLLAPAAAWASGGGMEHATSFELRRDGALIVNFLILFAGLFWIAKRVVIPFLAERSSRIAQNLEDAEKARMDAMKKFSDVEYRLRQFEKEAAKTREAAIEEGERLKARMIEEGKLAARYIIDKARIEMENETLKAKARLRKDAVEFAVRLASRMVEEKVSDDDRKRMLKEYLHHVGSGG